MINTITNVAMEKLWNDLSIVEQKIEQIFEKYSEHQIPENMKEKDKNELNFLYCEVQNIAQLLSDNFELNDEQQKKVDGWILCEDHFDKKWNNTNLIG